MTASDNVFDAIRGLIRCGVAPEAMERELWDRVSTRAAVLVCDSCGFTRITQARGVVHFLTCITRARDVLRPVFERHGAWSFRAEADNVYSEFDTVDQAFETAVEANAALADAKIMLTDDERFGICIGIGYGRVLRAGREGVFGHEMNLASKLGEDLAKGGEVLLTEAALARLSPQHTGQFDVRHTEISGVAVTYHGMTCSM